MISIESTPAGKSGPDRTVLVYRCLMAHVHGMALEPVFVKAEDTVRSQIPYAQAKSCFLPASPDVCSQAHTVYCAHHSDRYQ